MATLTNSFHNCQLLNLGVGPGGRGPFIIRQEGTAPNSTTFQQESFLLRNDGTWVLNLAVFPLSEKEKEQFFYKNSAEAIQVLDGLTGEPKVEAALPQGQSVEQLRAAAKSTISGLWGRIREAKPSA